MRKYLDIANALEHDIRQHHSPGDLLASEASMAARFGVNRHTIRRALDELAFSGLIDRQQGRGTRVRSTPYVYPLHRKAKFTDNLLEQGSLPSAKVISRRMIPATKKLAEILAIDEESQVMHMVTLRKVNGTPLTLIDHYLPVSQWWPALKHFAHGSLHKFIAEQYQVVLQRQETKVSAKLPKRQCCEQLGVCSRTPLLVLKTINVIPSTGQVAEYSRAHTRSDLVEIQLEH
ncbi:phosphonate metabolism transcriptional regulator PhnF [Salinibius halmophilus]|uniref:phosphonate metabolism transcriptional regulator PhnF n=1 Tax=Salinibius halmophilus TaxID=1853216 RepID=UPI000E6715AC|nr:phosphonate metabolism transcriptional regulator PhnF [Salinibius halmophilus]